MPAADNRHHRTHQTHLAPLPLTACLVWCFRGRIAKRQQIEFEEIRARKLRVGQGRTFSLASAPADGTSQDIDIREILWNQVRKPVGQLFMFELVALNGLEDGFKISGASLFFFLRRVSRRRGDVLGDSTSQQGSFQAGQRQPVCQAAYHTERLCSELIISVPDCDMI